MTNVKRGSHLRFAEDSEVIRASIWRVKEKRPPKTTNAKGEGERSLAGLEGGGVNPS